MPQFKNGSSSVEFELIGQEKAKLSVVFFGRLEERKGLCTFIEAIKLLAPKLKSRLSVTFLGRIVALYSTGLEHLMSDQYINNELDSLIEFRIVSNLYSKEAIGLVSSMKNCVVCLTSPQENFPNSALEMGQLPVRLVVADIGGFHETLQLIQRSEGLYWFKPQDAHSLAAALTKALLQVDGDVPQVPSTAAIEKINETLLVEKTALIQQAFNRGTANSPPSPTVTVGLACKGDNENLIAASTCLKQQTYENLEVLILNSEPYNEIGRERFEHAKSSFPDYQFIRLDHNLNYGAALNHLVSLATGSYFLPINPSLLMLPFAIEKFVAAANTSGASIVTCARKDVGVVDRVFNFSEATLPSLIRADLCSDLCAMFSMSYLQKFRFSEEQGIHSQTWELLAAAIATDKKVTYYPYPLCEYFVSADMAERQKLTAKAQFHLRQYLATISPSDWSPRQLYMLLTATQQLGYHVPALSGADLQLQEVQTSLQRETEELNRTKSDLYCVQVNLEQARGRIAAMETSKFWRFRQSWFQLKKAFKLPSNE